MSKLKNLIFFTDLGRNSFSPFWLPHTFAAFQSINHIFYLIYANENHSLVSYNIINNKKINEVKNAHDRYITNIREYLDQNNNKDLIISISGGNNNLKLWNLDNFECILNIKNVNKGGFLNSAFILNDNNNYYIFTINDRE